MTHRTARERMEMEQHFGWLRGYLAIMKPENWRDMKDRIEHQLDRLEPLALGDGETGASAGNVAEETK